MAFIRDKTGGGAGEIAAYTAAPRSAPAPMIRRDQRSNYRPLGRISSSTAVRRPGLALPSTLATANMVAMGKISTSNNVNVHGNVDFAPTVWDPNRVGMPGGRGAPGTGGTAPPLTRPPVKPGVPGITGHYGISMPSRGVRTGGPGSRGEGLTSGTGSGKGDAGIATDPIATITGSGTVVTGAGGGYAGGYAGGSAGGGGGSIQETDAPAVSPELAPEATLPVPTIAPPRSSKIPLVLGAGIVLFLLFGGSKKKGHRR